MFQKERGTYLVCHLPEFWQCMRAEMMDASPLTLTHVSTSPGLYAVSSPTCWLEGNRNMETTRRRYCSISLSPQSLVWRGSPPHPPTKLGMTEKPMSITLRYGDFSLYAKAINYTVEAESSGLAFSEGKLDFDRGMSPSP